MMARSWQPGGVPPVITLGVHLALLGMMIVRGVDYATGESPVASHRLGAVEQAAPLWLWGLVFTTAAAIGLACLAWRAPRGVIIAHTVGAGLYAAVGTGLVIDAINRRADTGGEPSFVLLIPVLALVATIAGAWQERGLSVPVAVATGLAVALGAVSIEMDGLRNAVILLGIASLHALIASGTAQVAAQARIRRDRESEVSL